jgi:uncharacterized protein YuzE
MEKIEGLLESVPHLIRFPSPRVWIDYDEEADVLYISFRKPQQADDSEMEGDVIYHYRERELVGATILNAKARSGDILATE